MSRFYPKIDKEIDMIFSLLNIYIKEYLIKKYTPWDKKLEVPSLSAWF